MSVANDLVGQKLSGKRIPGQWTVIEKLQDDDQNTYGNYSVAYKARHENGKEAFLKASDLELLTEDNGDLSVRMYAALSIYHFERRILEHCKGKNMDRVVVALDYGGIHLNYDGQREPIFYLIFELAKSDCRIQVSTQKRLGFLWTVNAMHNLAVAVQQLHKGGVSHNDLKPSNVLIFDDSIQKVADLGNATSLAIPDIRDKLICTGDPRFVAPEVLYRSQDEYSTNVPFEDRRAGDLYLLGSMATFLITGKMTTSIVIDKLDLAHKPRVNGEGWKGTFLSVIDYWRCGFSAALLELEHHLPHSPDGKLTIPATAMLNAVKELCEPDPSRRGHPHNHRGQHDKYSVQQYITLFDLLSRKSLLIN